MPEANNKDARFLASLNAILDGAGIPPSNSLEEIAAMPTDVESLAALRAGKTIPTVQQNHAAATRNDAIQSGRVMVVAASRRMVNFTQGQYMAALKRGGK